MIAASSTRKNPIIQSFRQGLDYCKDLKPEAIRETRYNEPLINWHSFDGEEALYALRESNGDAYNISDSKLREMSTLLSRKEGLLIALLEMNSKMNLEPDRYVVILTAKN